ncbi:MAG: 30S ribosomal protein S16 [Patescibacteria group bacterium]
MLMIRLLRVGKKHQPLFKIVVTDKRNSARGGRSNEEVGFWDPVKKTRTLKKERILHWLSKGAQPSDTVHNMLVAEKIIEAKKTPVHKKSKKKPSTETPPLSGATAATPAPIKVEAETPTAPPETGEVDGTAKTE